MTSWDQIRGGWSAGWRTLAGQAGERWSGAVRVDPTGALARVQAFVTALDDSRAALDRIAAKLPNPLVTKADRADADRHRALTRRWHELAAGFYADARPAQAEIGAPPAVLIVGGLAVGAAGVAWAFAANQYALNLREQTALAERELDARIAASREGRTLPPSTLPTGPDARSVGLWLLGGLALAAGALTVPVLLKR